MTITSSASEFFSISATALAMRSLESLLNFPLIGGESLTRKKCEL